ncbi:bacterio-opsin activator domain-containing protein [Halorientalis salina]|uniref:bacterio-opsin activator domain-containing protein n=1 Tax=Halorientalis salina TaxID=2932266 RepID=UPI00145D4902|nr:bacterio-opsin activator domain-containing protein [Halorientalis salina]
MVAWWEDDGGSTADQILDRVSDGVVALDPALRYTYVNRQAERLFGRDSSELLGECIWDVFPETARAESASKIEDAMRTQESMTYERYNPELQRWLEIKVYPDQEGLTIVFTDVTEQKARERELEQVLETTPVGVVVLTPGGEIQRANSRAEELLGLERLEIESRTYHQPEWKIWHADGTPVSRENHPVTTVLRTGEPVIGYTHGITLEDGTERWLSSNAAPVVGDEGEIERVVVSIEDVTELKRLDLLIERLQPVNDVLNHASTRETLEQEICDLLSTPETYELAWIGAYTPGTRTLEPDAWAGSSAEYAAELDIPLTETATADGPSRRAIETGTIQVVDDVSTDRAFAPWREQARDHGLQAVAVVPLVHDERVYGVLGLYTSRQGAFGQRERSLLQTLGEHIGQVVHALETETLLHADRVVELTFRSTDPNSVLVDASAELDCTITVDSAIPTATDAVLCYVTVEGTAPSAVRDRLAATSAVTAVRGLSRREGQPSGTLELELEHGSLAQALVAADAVVTANEVSAGTATVVCELTPDRDISGFVSQVTAQFPETELVAKHERDRSAADARQPTTQVLSDVFTNHLTDRQRQVVRAAFHAGYFASPRRSTATEISEALSITQSTFSYHLRNAQQTLFETLLESV